MADTDVGDNPTDTKLEETSNSNSEKKKKQKYKATFWVLGKEEGMCALAAASCCCCCGEVRIIYDWDKHKKYLEPWMTEQEFNTAMGEIDGTYRRVWGKHPVLNWGCICWPCCGCSHVATSREHKAGDQVGEVCQKLNRDTFHERKVKWSVGETNQTNLTMDQGDGGEFSVGERWRFVKVECGIEYELEDF